MRSSRSPVKTALLASFMVATPEQLGAWNRMDRVFKI
jgi:hypothetical protein